tara:strand:+ start:207 stop:935 length:729 start_codon:yes stop_codon:yes gene_type:complete
MKTKNIKEDLSAVFRYAARLNMHESVVNHFCVCVSEHSNNFYVNKCGIHFSRIKTSDLILVTPDNVLELKKDPNLVDSTALSIHNEIHNRVTNARCILHLHSKFATALSCLKDPTLYPVDQNSMMFYNRVSYYKNYGGMGFDDEATRMCESLGNNKCMLLANHGVLITGKTIAEAFNSLYYFERACETYLTSLATNKELNIVDSVIAEKTAKQWEDYPSDLADNHLREIRLILDKEEPDYKN